jgi:MFS family permease
MPPIARLLAGGFLTLVLVMGVGRFYYTPLLPLMQRDFGFGAATAGLIGSANFAGYLAGSIAASFVPRGAVRLWTFRLALAGSAATTLAMGLTDSVPLWLALRFAGGVATALAMLAAAGMIAEALAEIDEPGLVGWVFGGVGAGIAASALFVNFARDAMSSSQLWIAAGIAGLLLVPAIIAEMGDRRLAPRVRRSARVRRTPRPLPFLPLLASYTAEGLGFSVFAVFIVAIVKSRPGLEHLGDWVWVMVGVAGLPSCLFWAWTAERIGFATALLLAFLAQIAGVLLPALSDASAAALVAAVLFGGTFLGITVLTLPLGRHGLGGRGFAVLTVGFGAGQVIGPIAAGAYVTGPEDWNTALVASAAVVALGAVALGWGIRTRRALESGVRRVL